VLRRWIRQIKKWLGSEGTRYAPLVHRRRPARPHLESLEERINPNATLNILSGGLQILIAGPDTVNLSTVNGNLVISDSSAGQTITDTTGKFAVAGAAGNQTATENASLVVDFTSLTITGTGGGQTVNFTGGSFVATNVNDGTIPTVGFANALSSFSGDLNIASSTSLTVSAAISGSDAINIVVGGTNAALNVNANVTSQYGAVTLQATGDVNIGAGVAMASANRALSLGADLTPAADGDDGIGTLAINASASLYGFAVTLRGAAEDISPTATIGSAVANESVVSTFVDNTHGLSNPNGLIFDGSGNLYVSNNGTDTINKVTASGAISAYATNSLIQNPNAMAFDNAGNLFVACAGNNSIIKITPAGVVSTFYTAFGLASAGLAFGSNGNLYAATGNSIIELTPSAVVSTFVNTTQGLSGPGSMAFDSGGNLFVINQQSQSVSKITPNGVVSNFLQAAAFLNTVGSPGDALALTFDASGNLYVPVNDINNSVVMVTPAGIIRVVIPYFPNGGRLVHTIGLVVDGSGGVYSTDSSAGMIDKISVMPILATTNQITIRSSVPSRPISLGGTNNAAIAGINLTNTELAAIATTSTGRVTFGDEDQTGNITINMATLATTLGSSTWIQQSVTGAGQITLIDGNGSATALNGNGGSIELIAGTGGIVAASANNNTPEIATTGPSGTPSNRIQFADNSNTAEQIVTVSNYLYFNVPPGAVYLDGLGSLTIGTILAGSGAAVSITSRNNLAVVANSVIQSENTLNSTISLGADLTFAGTGDNGAGTLTIGSNDLVVATNLNLSGADFNISPTATVYGLSGNTPPTLLSSGLGPWDMVFDASGDLFVANKYDNTVSEFAPGSTTPVATLTGLDTPEAVAVDKNSNIYVANSGNNTVSVFAPGKTTPTSTLAGFNNPISLVVDANGTLYVANRDGFSVSEFAPGSISPTVTISTPGTPNAMTLDSNGNLYVACLGNPSVVKYLAGQTQGVLGITAALGHLPSAVAIDSHGNIFVANGDNNTVNEYGPTGGSPITVYPGLPGPSKIVFDSSGNVYVSYFYGDMVLKFVEGNPVPIGILSTLAEPVTMAFDNQGNLYVGNSGINVVSKFTLSGPVPGIVTIVPSLPSLPMSIGGTNNSAVIGVNLTAAELATVALPNGGSSVFGSNSQTGNITFSAGAAATAAGTNTVVMQSPSGPGAIILDDGGGSGTALNGNGGTIGLTSGAGGIQALSAPNNVPEIGNAAVVSLTSSGGLGTSQPLELSGITNLSTNTTAGNGNQFLNMLGTIGPASLNAGTGSITEAGSGSLLLAGSNFSGSTLVVNGAVTSNITVSGGQTLMGTGLTGPVTVQSGATFYSGTSVSALTTASLILQNGSTFNAVLNTTSNYSGVSIVPTGTVSLGGASLVFSGSLVPANGQSFFLVNNLGSQPVGGIFKNLPEGTVIPNFMGSSLNATITYVGGDGNDVVVNVGSAATTTTTVIVSAATVTYGQPVTMTAIVSASAGTPTGSVQFFDATNGASLGAGTLQTSGAGTTTWVYMTTPTQLQVRGGVAYVINAVYTPSPGFFGNAGTQAGAITVNPANLTVSGVTASNKIYDQTTVATINTSSAALVGVIGGDTVTLGKNGVTGTFASKDVANNITVTVTGLTISGALAGNYTLTQPTSKANITVKNVLLNGITASNKVYDHTTAVTLNLTNAALGTLFPGDVVTWSITASFQSKTVGNHVLVNSTLTIGGAQAADYRVLLNPSQLMANITPAAVTVTGITANSKMYDGTTAATINTGGATLAGVFSGDSVSLVKTAATGAFTSMNAGTSLTVMVSGLTLSGIDASDYTVTQPSISANITARPLTITAVTNTKTYDSTTTAAPTPTVSGLAAGDSVTGLAEVFSDRNAISTKALSVSAYTINDGNNGNNYTVTTLTNTTGVINKAPITITATTNTKTYDGTTTAAAIPTVSGIFGSDTVTGLAEVYRDPHAGSSKPLSVSAYTINDGNSGNNYSVTTVIDSTGVITNPIDHFVLIPNTSSATAGVGFAMLVIAENASNQPVNYNGPVALTSNDPKVLSEGTIILSGGYGAAVVALDTATSAGWTLTATVDTVSITSSGITVSPGTATSFLITAPNTATTGSAFGVTVKAQDSFGNTATGYTGTVRFTSPDGAFTPISNYAFTGSGTGHDNGVHTFTSSLTLNTPGSQTITATDTSATNPTITGTSSPISTRGLVVTSFTPTPTGFTASFSKAFIPNDLTLYGANKTTVQDVTLIGTHVGPIHGSLIIDPSNMSVTFKATASYLLELNGIAQSATVSAVLPDDTYKVTLVSGSGTNGFIDALGAHLDGTNNGGHANFTTSFATHYQTNATPVLGIPDFARGPDSNSPIKVPNNGANGIPLTLYNAANVTDVTFALTYNPALLNITGVLSGNASDATDAAATLALVSNTGGVATFHYTDTNPQSATSSTPLVLGDLVAVVPSGAGAAALSLYQTKEFLQLGSIVINQGTITGAVAANGVHVNSYFGDVTGDKVIDGLDKLSADNVAQGRATGFSAYVQLDPVIIGDVAGDLSVDAGDVSTFDLFGAQFHPAQIPMPPTQLLTTDPNYVNPGSIHSPNAADPTLSLTRGLTALGSQVVSVNIDHPDPEGSTGLTSVTLALTYDSKILSVSAADITLGSLTGQGSGWQLSAVVDQATGQIGIQLYSPTPITVNEAGSLVNIAFQLIGEPTGVSPRTIPAVQLVDAVTPNGQWFGTGVADSQGALILSPGEDQLAFNGTPSRPWRAVPLTWWDQWVSSYGGRNLPADNALGPYPIRNLKWRSK
jgi:YDG domain